MRRAFGLRLALLTGALTLIALTATLSEASPPAGQVPIEPTYVDTPYVLRTLELSTGGWRRARTSCTPRYSTRMRTRCVRSIRSSASC